MSIRTLMSVAVLATAIVVGGSTSVATADMSKAVISAFRGQLVISKGDLPEGKNDKDTIAKIKSAKLTSLDGEAREDVTYWHFSYAAFLSKTGATTLKMEFYNGKQLSADKTLDGIDGKSSLLTGEISINEDEGLANGKTYTIKLIAGSNTVVAQTQLTMK
jgi:Ca2+-binding RTX toxin-like protein